MNKLIVYNINGEKKEEVEVDSKLFPEKVNRGLIYYAVLQQLASKRKGTACTKEKGEVSGGGKKPWKQKGTGRARQGSIRAPQWRGGGVIFGPKPRSFKYDIPKKARRKALFIAIADKIKNNNLILLDEFKILETKTKNFMQILKNLKVANEKVLIVYDEKNNNIIKSGRNIDNVGFSRVSSLNVYDILNSNKLIITKDAFLKKIGTGSFLQQEINPSPSAETETKK